jgi:hypothetical protein
MSDAALARTYEIYRTACGLRKDGLPRPATMQHFWEVWEECRRRLEQSGEHVALDERLFKEVGKLLVRALLALRLLQLLPHSPHDPPRYPCDAGRHHGPRLGHRGVVDRAIAPSHAIALAVFCSA